MILDKEIRNFRSTPVTPELLNEDVMLEVYFGDAVLKDIQAQFSKFRAKWIGKDWNPKINYDAELIKFNRMVEKQFGYYRFCLNVDPSYDYNAYMINIGWMCSSDFDDEVIKNLKVYKSSKGFYFEKDAKISAMASCYFGIITNKAFTDREVLGIMLHEIGHTFTYAVLNKEGAFNRGSYLVAMMKKVSKKVKKNLESDRDFSDARIESDINDISFLQKIKNFFSSIKDKKFNIKDAIHSVAQSTRSMKGNMKYYDYTNEKFADTFASMYGYGSEVQSALEKFTQLSVDFYMPKKTPSNLSVIIKVGMMSFTNMLEFLMGVQDEHPSNLTRIQTQIDYLKKELRNASLDPAMKADLQKQLEEQQKLIDDFINYSGDPDAYKVYRTYYTKMYQKYGGDIREKFTDNEALFDNIDRVYGQLKNESADIDDDELFSINPLNNFLN